MRASLSQIGVALQFRLNFEGLPDTDLQVTQCNGAVKADWRISISRRKFVTFRPDQGR